MTPFNEIKTLRVLQIDLRVHSCSIAYGKNRLLFRDLMMFLSYTGNPRETITGLLLEAHDGDQRVLVEVSVEALQDYKIIACQDKGSEKYFAGNVDRSGPVPKVSVKTSDF
ncbi:hypothetical protein LQT97_00635 [Brucella pseudogrignonensis]|uniref:hypothetical protein n=1 Tax=Brucella pseudogrignonensis TaxID=419475 RepID=UPI001E40C920|nr:hypothetical protein [Brucella pseudogrignonensis]MCD4509730.1 hypothetical protein [Brucella pseudogrignonensis]